MLEAGASFYVAGVRCLVFGEQRAARVALRLATCDIGRHWNSLETDDKTPKAFIYPADAPTNDDGFLGLPE